MWQSLACNYLAIMASSVSSEWAFSLASITICKRHNCLDADIVEALQCLKSLIHQDLMAWDIVSIADEEQDLNYEDEQPTNQDSTAVEVVNTGDDLLGGISDEGDGTADAGGTTDIDSK
jgi:hypothetical protein